MANAYTTQFFQDQRDGSLASGESGLATMAFIVSHALFLEDDRSRFARLFVYVPVLVVWFVLYRHLGFGTSGSALYIDPGRDPLRFAGAAIERLPQMIVATIVAAPDGQVYINTTGNAGMATGGTGDVLTGIAASFIGQHPNDPLSDTVAAVYLHGLAGDIAASKLGTRAMVASDISNCLYEAFIQAGGEAERLRR